MEKKNHELNSYEPEYYALTPSSFVKFMRVFWPWQILRFLYINFKMVKMIGKSHGKKRKLKG